MGRPRPPRHALPAAAFDGALAGPDGQQPRQRAGGAGGAGGAAAAVREGLMLRAAARCEGVWAPFSTRVTVIVPSCSLSVSITIISISYVSLLVII